jgi:hypothetical protein
VANEGERDPDLVCERAFDYFPEWRKRWNKGSQQSLAEHPLTTASRFIAGAFGLFNLIQFDERPER